MTTREECINIKGFGMVVHSLLGIKPHFAGEIEDLQCRVLLTLDQLPDSTLQTSSLSRTRPRLWNISHRRPMTTALSALAV